MAQLIYRFMIEENEESPTTLIFHKNNLPHEKEIKDFIQKTWNDCKNEILSSMDESIKPYITSLDLRFPKQTDDTLYGYIYITPKPKFRWNASRRQTIWDNLDDQMTDGFGECIDHHMIHEDTITDTIFTISI